MLPDAFNAAWLEHGSQGPASAPMRAAPHPHGLDVIRSRRNRTDVWRRRTRLSPLPASGSSADRGMRLRPVRNSTVTWHLPPMPYRATEPGFGSPNFRPASPPRSKSAEVTSFSLKQRDPTSPFLRGEPVESSERSATSEYLVTACRFPGSPDDYWTKAENIPEVQTGIRGVGKDEKI
jgi:hypothetical protein